MFKKKKLPKTLLEKQNEAKVTLVENGYEVKIYDRDSWKLDEYNDGLFGSSRVYGVERKFIAKDLFEVHDILANMR